MGTARRGQWPQLWEYVVALSTRLAPAKINLMLHVTGRETSGFHALQSLFAFTSLADELTIELCAQDQVVLSGPFASAVLPEHNSIISAIQWFYGLFPDLKRSWSVSLVKNIPVAAGLGGGTSDAAAMIAFLIKAHGVKIADLPSFIISSGALGADVPVCLAHQFGVGSLFWLEGSGKTHYPQPVGGNIPYKVILVNPLKLTSTKDVFYEFAQTQTYSLPLAPYTGAQDLLPWLKRQRNDLENAACSLVPEIRDVLAYLSSLPGCLLARMSGTGATCFALFDPSDDIYSFPHKLQIKYSHWWAQSFNLLS